MATDTRITNVQNEAEQQKTAYDQQYNDMLTQRDALTNQQKQMIDNWANQEKSTQEGNTNLALDKIQQQKDETAKGYTKEQSGAYTDMTKATGAYGANAEQLAANGLQGSGYSETSKVNMYNAYQNRVGIARESYMKSILEYDNNIKEAKLNYNTKLAEISYTQLQNSLTLALSSFDFKNSAWQNKLSYMTDLNNTTWNKTQDIQGQINYEQQAAEAKRQWELEIAYKKEQDAQAQRNWQSEYNLAVKKASSSGGGGGSNKQKTGGAIPVENTNVYDSAASSGKEWKIQGGYGQIGGQGAVYYAHPIYSQGGKTVVDYRMVKVGSAQSRT